MPRLTLTDSLAVEHSNTRRRFQQTRITKICGDNNLFNNIVGQRGTRDESRNKSSDNSWGNNPQGVVNQCRRLFKTTFR